MAGYLYYLGHASLPQIDGAVRLPGLTAAAEVLRDRHGVPHVYASSLEDLVRATGYVHAQDRLFQMELSRRLGIGTMAELFGEPLLPADRLARRLGLGDAAGAELERSDPEVRRLLQIYAEGVNAYREAQGDKLSPGFQILQVEPEPWKPADSLAIAKGMSYLLSFNGSVEVLRADLAEVIGIHAAYSLTGLSPPAEGDIPATAAHAMAGMAYSRRSLGWTFPAASNAWSVSGERTASGKPLLASDPHLPLTIPSIFYELHLSGGGLDVAGASLPGIPFVLLGHNDRIAWGATALFADVQDHYVETLNPENPRQYAAGDHWEDFEGLTENIAVAGAGAVTLEVIRSRHGVVVSEEPHEGKVLALRWDGLWTGDNFLAFLRVNRASSWFEFTEALRTLASPPLAFVYADVEGNIGFFPAGDIPVRSGFDGTFPVDGASGAFEWHGSVPHEMKPLLFNPEQGYIVSANHRMVPGDAPYSLGRDQLAPFRAHRIASLLESGGQLEAGDFARIQADQYDSSTESVLRHLVALDADPETAPPLALLRSWSGQMGQGPAPAFYQAFYLRLLENTFRDELGAELLHDFLKFLELGFHGGVYAIIDEADSIWWDDRSTSPVETRTDIFRRALSDAVALLKDRQGEDPESWDWGTLHGVFFQHPVGHNHPLDWLFNRGPVA
ncbi:MAG: penicillin acylase family protein, partial [Acidobacteriota bacterium]